MTSEFVSDVEELCARAEWAATTITTLTEQRDDLLAHLKRMTFVVLALSEQSWLDGQQRSALESAAQEASAAIAKAEGR